MTDTTKLPPLPERECSLDSGQLDLFTADQMRAYGAECRRMALDEAASMLDAWAKSAAECAPIASWQALVDGAKAIRALKDKA